ncbi:MAG: hypothetical protein J6K32_08310 [Clostridia bacterium]|nr:hypothetical protein [Clostridia bacterium]
MKKALLYQGQSMEHVLREDINHSGIDRTFLCHMRRSWNADFRSSNAHADQNDGILHVSL